MRGFSFRSPVTVGGRWVFCDGFPQDLVDGLSETLQAKGEAALSGPRVEANAPQEIPCVPSMFMAVPIVNLDPAMSESVRCPTG